MTACEEDDKTLYQNSIILPHFYRKQRNRFIFGHLTQRIRGVEQEQQKIEKSQHLFM